MKDSTKSVSNYQLLASHSGVKTKVPKINPMLNNFRKYDAHEFTDASGKKVKVDTHWRVGMQIVGSKVIVNRHFYGVSSDAPPKTIVANVEIRRRVLEGKEYIVIDFHAQPGVRPTREIKFKELVNSGVGILIPGTKTQICFEPI